MRDSKAWKRTTILHVLKQQKQPLSSADIAEELARRGQDMSRRTIRLYLQQLDGEGLTVNCGKQGRRITEKGIADLAASQTLHRVGFLSGRIDQITYRMDFDLARRTGAVVVNTSLVTPSDLSRCLGNICQVFAQGYAMGQLTGLLTPGDTLGPLTVPEGMLGLCTVCSITLNGVLLKCGVPTHSRFGGLLEIHRGRPTRFLEIINYDGTSIDPLEIFIRSGMTDYLGAITTGEGRIGASFREIPAESEDLVARLAEKLKSVGLGGFLSIGQPGQDLFDIPVSEGRAGAVVIGGLNPVAILEENGIRVTSRALSGLIDYNHLFPYTELEERIRPHL